MLRGRKVYPKAGAPPRVGHLHGVGVGRRVIGCQPPDVSSKPVLFPLAIGTNIIFPVVYPSILVVRMASQFSVAMLGAWPLWVESFYLPLGDAVWTNSPYY